MSIRKKGCLLACLFLLCNTAELKSQSLDEIISRHIDAMGGAARLDSLKTVMFEGTFRLEGWELPLKASLSHQTGQRYDVMIMKVPSFIIATPLQGWQYFPIQGMKEPVALKTEELDPYIPFMDLQGVFFKYREKGTRIELAGTEEVDDAICFKINVQFATGKKMTAYVDSTRYLIVKETLPTLVDGKESILETRFGNFLQTAEGYTFPFAMTLGPGQAFVSKIYINPVFDRSIFLPALKPVADSK